MRFNWSFNDIFLTLLRKVKGATKEEVTSKLTAIGLEAARGDRDTPRAIHGGTVIENPNGKGFAVRLQYDPSAPDGTKGEFPKFIQRVPVIFEKLDALDMML